MKRSMLAVLLVLASVTTWGQTQTRVQAGDVTHVGTITLPPGIGNPNCLAVDGPLMAVCTYGGGQTGVAIVRLPASGFGQATLEQATTLLPNLNQVHIGGTYLDIVAGGVLPFTNAAGVKCIAISGWTYYDGGGGQVKSHWRWCPPTAIEGPFQMMVTDVGNFSNAPSQKPRVLSPLEVAELAKAPAESLNLGTRPGLAAAATWPRESFVGGYMGTVPPEWRALFGAAGLTGQCCVPIISRTSYGPSVSVFNPADVGVTEPIPSKMLVGYPIEHHTLGDWGISPPAEYYGGTDQLGSVGFPSGTRSVLFTGRHGDTFCYGPGTANKALVGTPGPGAYPYCYDPADFAQGNHGPLYRPTMWAYDANDLLQVKQGAKKPWEVFPYAKWTLPGMSVDVPNYMRAGYYDDVTRRYYVGDTSNTTIHVFAIGLGSGQPPPPPPPPPPPQGNVVTVDASVTHQTMRGWEITAEANQFSSGFAGYQNAAFDRVVEAGINRLRLEVRSGSENPVDYYGAWLAAGAQFSGTAYDTWRANRYTLINDNADPNTAAAGRYHWTEVDTTIDRIVNPLRAKLAAKGEALYVNLTFVSFYNGQTTPNILQTPAEYAEFMVELFRHIQAKYGWIPNAVNTVLEPDNTNNWGGTLLGQVIAAAGVRLQAAGFTPDFLAPSTTNMTTAPAWFDQLWAVTGARPFIKELSYHRYSGVTPTALAAIASKSQAAGIGSSMLEWWDAGHTVATLHEDLTTGRNSAHQQAVIVDLANPNGIAISYIPPGAPTTAVLTGPTRAFSQYYRAARMGAVRIGATSTLPALAPLAFRNQNGRFSVVVKATGASTFAVAGLPAGLYGITYATDSQSASLPDQTLAAGLALFTTIPASGVLTVLQKATGPPPPPPPPPVNCQGTWDPVWSRVVGSETACANNLRTFQERRYFTVTIPPINGGLACPVSPEFRTQTEPCAPAPPPPSTGTLTVGGATLTCVLANGVLTCK